MSIHDFHSKLTSGKEEGMLYEGLRRLTAIGKAALATGEERGWTYWTDGTEDASAEGWTNWTDGTQGACAEPGWKVWEGGAAAPSCA